MTMPGDSWGNIGANYGGESYDTMPAATQNSLYEDTSYGTTGVFESDSYTQSTWNNEYDKWGEVAPVIEASLLAWDNLGGKSLQERMREYREATAGTSSKDWTPHQMALYNLAYNAGHADWGEDSAEYAILLAENPDLATTITTMKANGQAVSIRGVTREGNAILYAKNRGDAQEFDRWKQGEYIFNMRTGRITPARPGRTWNAAGPLPGTEDFPFQTLPGGQQISVNPTGIMNNEGWIAGAEYNRGVDYEAEVNEQQLLDNERYLKDMGLDIDTLKKENPGMVFSDTNLLAVADLDMPQIRSFEFYLDKALNQEKVTDFSLVDLAKMGFPYFTWEDYTKMQQTVPGDWPSPGHHVAVPTLEEAIEQQRIIRSGEYHRLDEVGETARKGLGIVEPSRVQKFIMRAFNQYADLSKKHPGLYKATQAVSNFWEFSKAMSQEELDIVSAKHPEMARKIATYASLDALRKTGNSIASFFHGEEKLYEGLSGYSSLFSTNKWLHKTSPEFQEQFKIAYSEASIPDMLNWTSKEKDAFTYVIRNIVEEYRENRGFGGQLLDDTIATAPLWVFPSIAARQKYTQLERLAITYFKKQAIVAQLTRKATELAPKIALAASKSPVARTAEENALLQFSKGGFLDKAIASAAKDVPPVSKKTLESINAIADKTVTKHMNLSNKLTTLLEKWGPDNYMGAIPRRVINEMDDIRVQLEALGRQVEAQYLSGVGVRGSQYAESLGLKAGEELATITTDEALEAAIVDFLKEDSGLRVMAQTRFGRMLLRRLLRKSGVADMGEEILSKSIVLYRRQVGEARALARAYMNEILSFDSNLSAGKGADGILSNVSHIRGRTGADVGHIYDVLENADQYRYIVGPLKGKLVSEDPEVIAIHRMLEARFRMLQKEGVPVGEYIVPLGSKWFHHDVVTGKWHMTTGKQGEQLRNVDPSQFKHRLGWTLEEQMSAGVEFNHDYQALISKTMEESYIAVANQRFINKLKTIGVLKEGAIRKTKDLLKAESKIAWYEGLKSKIAGAKSVEEAQLLMNEMLTTSGTLKAAYKAGETGIRDMLPHIENALKWHRQAATKLANESIEKMRAIKGVPGTENLVWGSDMTKVQQVALNKKLLNAFRGKESLPSFVSYLTKAIAVPRFMVTGEDIGAPNIHGLLLQFNDPKNWARQWARQFQAMKDPQHLTKYFGKNRQHVINSIQKGFMNYENPEYMEAAGFLGKLPLIGKPVRMFERGFTGFVDPARLESWKSMYRPNMTAKEAKAVGQHIDKMMGSLSQINSGVTPMQNAIETLIFFAPRYYRSYLALIGDMFNPKSGMTCVRAWRKMAQFQGGLHLAYAGLAEATKPLTGEGAHLNPTDGRYLSFRIGDVWFGYGGIMRSINRLVAGLAEAVVDGKADRIPTYVIPRFLRGKLSLAASAGVDLTLGSDYIGGGFGDEGIFEIIRHLTEPRMTPFWSRNILETIGRPPNPEIGVGEHTLMTFAEFMGLRSHEDFAYMKEQQLKDERAFEYGMNWKQLKKTAPSLAAVIEGSPDVKAAMDKSQQESMEKGPDWSKAEQQYYEFKPLYDIASEKYKDARFDIMQNYRMGVYGRGAEALQMAEELKREVASEFAVKMDAWALQFPDVFAKYAEAPKIRDSENRLTAAIYDYKFHVSNNPTLHQTTTPVEYAQTEVQLNEDWLGRWDNDKELLDEVRRTIMIQQDRHPVDRILSIEQDIINETKDRFGRTYWDLPKGTPEKWAEVNQWLVQFPRVNTALFIKSYTQSLQTQEAIDYANMIVQDGEMPIAVPTEALDIARTQAIIENIEYEKTSIESSIPARSYATQSVREMKTYVSNIEASLKALEVSITKAISPHQAEEAMTKYYKTLERLIAFDDVIKYQISVEDEPHINLVRLASDRIKAQNKYRIHRIQSENTWTPRD